MHLCFLFLFLIYIMVLLHCCFMSSFHEYFLCNFCLITLHLINSISSFLSVLFVLCCLVLFFFVVFIFLFPIRSLPPYSISSFSLLFFPFRWRSLLLFPHRFNLVKLPEKSYPNFPSLQVFEFLTCICKYLLYTYNWFTESSVSYKVYWQIISDFNADRQ